MSKKIGIIGWRGMVGSVLLERMMAENDGELGEISFFSTSQAGQKIDHPLASNDTLLDAKDIKQIAEMDAVITCQGSGHTNEFYPELRKSGWDGIWIDASSALRMSDESALILDPLNKDQMLKDYEKGIRTFSGSNCTVSLLLLAIKGLVDADLVEWVSSMTYQAASGAGAKNMRELLDQMGALAKTSENNGGATLLEWDKAISTTLNSNDFPKENFGAPLAGNLLPYIDVPVETGQSREEWKATAEASKILGRDFHVDGTCVRVGSLRSHAQGLTLKLKKGMDQQAVEEIIQNSHEWMEFVPNEKEATLEKLGPAHISGTLNIAVGRVRPMNFGSEYFNLFTVGDQLLWGAAEPLRRALRILL